MKQDFQMVSGDTKSLQISIVDSDGVAVDVTGATVTYVISNGSGTILTTKTVGDGITIAGSVLTVDIDPADTDDLAGIYFHELQIVDGAGKVGTAMWGKVEIARDLVMA